MSDDPRIQAAFDAANWFITTASSLHYILDSQVTSASTLSMIKTLEVELFPNGTLSDGPRQIANKEVTSHLDALGPVSFGSMHASNAHGAAIEYARLVLFRVGAAAVALGVSKSLNLLADCGPTAHR